MDRYKYIKYLYIIYTLYEINIIICHVFQNHAKSNVIVWHNLGTFQQESSEGIIWDLERVHVRVSETRRQITMTMHTWMTSSESF